MAGFEAASGGVEAEPIDVSGSRELGTTYTNNRGAPIVLQLVNQGDGTRDITKINATLYLNDRGYIANYAQVDDSSDSGAFGPFTFASISAVVPAGDRYTPNGSVEYADGTIANPQINDYVEVALL